MMKLLASLFLLIAFTSISNGDICITSESNYGLQGNYVDMGQDSNGNNYWKEEDIAGCEDRYLFKLGTTYWLGTGYNAADGTYAGLNAKCNTAINSPSDCTSWSSQIVLSSTSCPEILTNTCNSIIISGVFSSMDGSYDKIADGVYQKDDNEYYFSFWENGRDYVLNTAGDVRCSGNSGSHYLRVDESQLEDITFGQEISMTPLYSCNGCGSTVSIACSSEGTSSGSGSGSGSNPSPTANPVPTPQVAGLGDLCLSTTTSFSSIKGVNIASMAGTYEEIENINSHPAYRLLSECNSAQYIIMYVSLYNRYMLVSDQNDPNSYINFCNAANTGENPVECTWETGGDWSLEISDGSCNCGVTPTPSPTSAPIPHVSGLGSVCLSTSSTATLNSGSGINVALSDLAGEYVEIDENINNKPAYVLDSGCGQSSTLMYVDSFGKYMFVRNRNKPTTTYYFDCDNYDSITNDDITQCIWGNTGINALLTVSQTGSSCICGLSP